MTLCLRWRATPPPSTRSPRWAAAAAAVAVMVMMVTPAQVWARWRDDGSERVTLLPTTADTVGIVVDYS